MSSEPAASEFTAAADVGNLPGNALFYRVMLNINVYPLGFTFPVSKAALSVLSFGNSKTMKPPHKVFCLSVEQDI